jgi:hypothetical protein
VFATIDGSYAAFNIASSAVTASGISVTGAMSGTATTIEIQLAGPPVAAGTAFRCGSTSPSAVILVSETAGELLTMNDCEVDLQSLGQVGEVVSGSMTATLLSNTAVSHTLVGSFRFIR